MTCKGSNFGSSTNFMTVKNLWMFRFSEREVAAVEDWLNSSLPFHAMRDHPAHGTAILGGMWGAR
jgi:hypothetical protein